MPIPSDPIELQLDGQADIRMTTRQEIAQNLREFLTSQEKFEEQQLLQMQVDMQDDNEISVEQAREQAAQMQAQMDAAVAAADAKRAEQQKQFEENIAKGDPAAQL